MKHVVTCKIKILSYILLNKTCDSPVQSKGRCKSLQNILQHMLEGVAQDLVTQSVKNKSRPYITKVFFIHAIISMHAIMKI